MVLEVRPDVSFDKGSGIDRLLRDADVDAALYIGDDRTDVDAFDALREAVSDGRLAAAVCIGVASDETPPELSSGADLLVGGPDGVRATLALLASA
jgi:trehalose 6-phosphate phosphatase